MDDEITQHLINKRQEQEAYLRKQKADKDLRRDRAVLEATEYVDKAKLRDRLATRNVFTRIDAGIKRLVSELDATRDKRLHRFKRLITPELRVVFDHLDDIVQRLDGYNDAPLRGEKSQLTLAQAFYFEPVEGVSDDDLADAVVDRRDPRHAGMGEVAIKALGNETSIAFKCIQALDKAKDLNKEDIYIKVGNSLRPIPRSGAYVKKQALACKDYGEVWKAKGKRSGNKKNK